MISKIRFIAVASVLLHCALGGSAYAALRVLTTTTDLKAVVEEVGGSEVSVESFCKGSQDPHFLEAKPSFIVKASQADLVVANGLGLEVGWLPNILSGSRNSRIMPGQSGYLEAGSFVGLLEVGTGRLTRADGDVHPEGNPHFALDPVRMGKVAIGIAERLAKLDPPHAAAFKSRAEALNTRLETKSKSWQERITRTGHKNVVTYHKTLTYFLDRFGLTNTAILEPLPGVPPTAKHIMEVIKTAREQGVRVILVENYFDSTVADRVSKDIPGVRVSSVAVSVEGESGIKTLDDLYERLVVAIEGKGT